MPVATCRLLSCLALVGSRVVAAASEEGAEETCVLQVAHSRVGSARGGTLPFVPQCSSLSSGLLGHQAPAGTCSIGDHVQCPGSESMCAGNQCCPGYAASGGKTFKCPSAAPTWVEDPCENHTKVESCLAPQPLPEVQGIVAGSSSYRVPDEVLKLIRADHELPPAPSPPWAPQSVVRLYPGTIYTFATLAQMAYCGIDHAGKAVTTLSEYKCPACEATGFALTGIGVVPVKIFGNATGTVAIVGRITPRAPTDKSLLSAPMREGCLVSIRGSDSNQEWMEDFEIWHKTISTAGCQGCRVHTGFWETWQAMRMGVLQEFARLGCNPDDATKQIYTTGHSLGGAVATVAAWDLHEAGFKIGGSITFESPRVGDANFQEGFNNAFKDALLYRVTYHRDIVVHVPPRSFGYQHVNPEIFYNTPDLDEVKICHKTEDPNCSYQFYRVSVDDHCNVPYNRGCQICWCNTAVFPAMD